MSQPTVWTSQQWVAYFRRNAKRLTEIPWKRDAGWTDEEREALCASLQDFQLGESSQGRFLLAQADRYAQLNNDPVYPEAMRLFVAEEQRTPVAVLGESCPEELSSRGASAHPGAREALRAVLLTYAGLAT